ncbi:MAG: hypothetical protein WCY01_10650 [Alkalispirochaeta sp.]
MNRRPQLLLFSITIVLVLALSGCSEGELGIFSTIAIEEATKKNNLVDNATTSGLVKGLFNGTERYVVKAGTKVFTRPVSGNDWTEISAPGGRLALFVAGRNDTATPAGLGGDEPTAAVGEVYAVYQSGSSDDTAVYRLSGNLAWTQAVYTPPSGTKINGMIGVDNVVFVSTFTSPTDQKLLAWSDEIGSVPTVAITGFNDAIQDGVRAGGVGSDYYLVGKSSVLAHVGTGPATTATPFNTTTTSPQPRGIAYSDHGGGGGILAVADRVDGRIFVAPAPTTPGSLPSSWKLAGTVGRPATDIIWVSKLNGSTGAFLVGTASDAIFKNDGRGYYQGTISGTIGTYTISLTNDLGNNYKASDLAVSSILQFRHFGKGTVFALTGGRGLWSTAYPDSADPTWRWE